MPSSRMNAKLTSGNIGQGSSGYNVRQGIISEIYRTKATQDFLFYQFLGNNQQAKRITLYPAYAQNYYLLKKKYGTLGN